MRHNTVVSILLLLLPSILPAAQMSWFGSTQSSINTYPKEIRQNSSTAMAGATAGRTGEYLAKGPKTFENERKTGRCIGRGMFTIANKLIVGYYNGITVMNQNLWLESIKFNRGGPPHAIHAVSGDIVFVSSGATVSAWHMFTKSRLWQYSFSNPKDRSVISTPVIYKNKLYCFRKRHIYAFNLKTGKIEWTYKSKGRDLKPNFAVGNGILCFSISSHLKALDAETGKMKWFSPIQNYAFKSPIIAKNMIFIPSDYKEQYPHVRMAAFHVNTGKLLWKSAFDMGFSPFKSAVSGNIMIIPGRSKLAAINIIDGTTIWTTKLCNETDTGLGNFCTNPVIADGVAYMKIGELITAIDIHNGRKLWAHNGTATYQRDANMVVSDGRLYYMNRGEILCCISGDTDWPDSNNTSKDKIVDQMSSNDIGEVSWESQETCFKGCTLSYGNGNIYAANEKSETDYKHRAKNNVYCFDADSGNRKDFNNSTFTRRCPQFTSDKLLLLSDTDFTCVDANSGKLNWKHDDTKLRHSLPVFLFNTEYENFILATVRNSFDKPGYSFIRSLKTGEKLWSIDHKDVESGLSEPQKPVLSSNNTVACFKTGTQTLTGLELRPLAVKWKVNLKGNIVRGPEVYKDSFIAIVNKGVLQCINVNAHSGKITSTRYLPGSSTPAASTIVDDLLLYIKKNKEIHALNLNTWKRQWRLKLQYLPDSTIYLKNNVILFADKGHKLLAIEYNTGKLIGKAALPHLWPPSLQIQGNRIFYTDTFGRIVVVKLNSSK